MPHGRTRSGSSHLRRRQPLLRGARRLHPPPRSRRCGPRCVQWCEIGRRQVPRRRRPGQPRGGEPHVRPRGASRARCTTTSAATPTAAHPLDMLAEREPIRAAYRDRDARLETMDEQGLDQAWMFPTLGMIYEELLKHDPEAVAMHVHRVQPLGRRGLGLRLPGPDLRRAVHRRWPILDWALSRARMGARPRRPHRRHAPGRGPDRQRRWCPRPTRRSIRSGRGSTRPASPSWSTPATAATPATATPTTRSRPASRAVRSGRPSSSSRSSGRPTTSS